MTELCEITLQNIGHIADVRKSLLALENDIFAQNGIGISLTDFEETVSVLSLTARDYQRLL